MPRKSLFPPVSIDDALVVAKAIWESNAGQPTRRITIFDSLRRQPDSSTSRSLITASSSYGLTEGGYQSEIIKLTELGRQVVGGGNKLAKLNAVVGVELFRAFYDRYKDAVVPGTIAALDFIRSKGISEDAAQRCLDIILDNGRQVGLIQTASGKERIFSIEHVRELLSNSDAPDPVSIETANNSGNEIDRTNNEASRAPQNNSRGPSERTPTIHIDVQIHISADAKPEQIDQIFASMAKHLYGQSAQN